MRVYWLKIFAKYYRHKFLGKTLEKKLFFIKRFDREKFISLSIITMIEDMHTHLAPIAEVYKREDPEAEEAISCIEALARVPQQTNKWGYLTTRATMHDLYKVYYNEVIPSLIENYQHITRTRYKRNYTTPKANWFKRFLTKLKIIGQKDKFEFDETRDV
jgi:hypothetical protein